MNLSWQGLAALGLVLLSGIGGSLGAVALGAPDLAGSILGFAGGLIGGAFLDVRKVTQ